MSEANAAETKKAPEPVAPAPAPVVNTPAPAPAVNTPAPAPAVNTPAPAPAVNAPAPEKPADDAPAPDGKPAEDAPAADKPVEDAAPVSDIKVGSRVAKKFKKRNYYGEITEKWTDDAAKAPRWHVKYDDGDEEDLNEKELARAARLYEKVKKNDQKINPRKPRSTPTKRKSFDGKPPPRSNKYPKRKSTGK
ncbi:unnamed protein product [Pseudo-nitzschia multistriata]|uniref:PTM/DIR17-like Tudor domain-containing protein n=1 Tax=Pseudo-nitzschia multistriata TaxID=183589 RepID=A0A448Z9T7_9STRA|nr:unnamed protein product [Pseudo-nitzschia multistriata]